MSLKKVSIVFEEKEGTALDAKGMPGNKFDVYLDSERVLTGIHPDQLSAAEFWGLRMFAIVRDVMGKCGAIAPISQPPQGPKQ